MKKGLHRLNLSWGTIVLALLVLLALTRTHRVITSPNLSFVTQIPNVEQEATREEIDKIEKEYRPDSVKSREGTAYLLFRQLYHTNPELAEELGRIPEFVDNHVSERDIERLRNLTVFYINSEYREQIDKTLEWVLNNIGKREYGRYSSSLQAYFWLSTEESKSSLSYLRALRGRAKGMRLIRRAWRGYQGDEWKNFEDVVDRLNSPELVVLYMRNNFRLRVHWGEDHWSPKGLFRVKWGDCEEHAAFSTFCLRRAGYDAKYTEVPACRKHKVCLYTEDGRFFAIDNQTLRGPFNSRAEAYRVIRRFH